jgi:hypothetical protein
MQVTNSFIHPDLEKARSGWFPCSCCPTNLVRLLPSVPGYIYAQKDNEIYTNLFITCDATLSVSGKPVEIHQQNNYPWDGDLKFTVNPKKSFAFSMLIRIPGWARNIAMPSDLYSFENNSDEKVSISINGKKVSYSMKNGYAVLERKWEKNDVIEVKLPMQVRRVVANSKVKNDIGRVALQRGPIMYCGEWIDNNGKASNVIMPANTEFETSYNPDLLKGIETLHAEVPAVIIKNDGKSIQTHVQKFTAIPYYAWANRGAGEMMLWFPETVKDIELVSNE